MVQCRPSFEADTVRVNEALRVLAWSSKQAPLHASSEKHSAHYQCARLEMIHSASILSEATLLIRGSK